MRKKGVYNGYRSMNKKGGFTDLLLFIIIAVVLVFTSGIYIYIGQTTQTALHENMDDMPLHTNVSEVIDNSFGELNESYSALYWISVLLIVGMIFAIFIGNYFVTTKPITFLPYIIVVIIAIVVAVGVTIAYQQVIETPELETVFDGFVGANFILNYLPLWVAVLGIGGGVIMVLRLGSGDGGGGYERGYYG